MANLISAIDKTADDVREIMGGDTNLTDGQIQAMMNSAYYLISPLSGELGDCGGDAAFDTILLYVAAHLITLPEQQVKSEKIGGEASVSYWGQAGMGLNGSKYGQMALAMDCSGKLASLGLKEASFSVWDHDTIDYDDSEDIA